MVVLPEARVPTASRLADENESIAAAREVASIPTDMNEWSATDIDGAESV